jgi:hypothetical protein
LGSFDATSIMPHHPRGRNLRYRAVDPCQAKSSCADSIAHARELLAVARPEGQPTAAAVDPGKPSCPCCGGRMIIIEVFARDTTPRYQPGAPASAIRIDTS